MTDSIARTTGKVAAATATLVGVPGAIYFFVDQARLDAARWLIVESAQGVPLRAGNYLIANGLLFALVVALIIAIGSWTVLLISRRTMNARTTRSESAAAAATSLAQRVQAEMVAAERVAEAARDNLAAAQADVAMQEAYDATCEALQRVVYRSYNPVSSTEEPPPPVIFKTIDCTFEIGANGDANVTQVYEIEAARDPARFWTVRLEADKYAEPFKTLRAIDFTATSLTEGTSVEPIPIDNRGLKRSVAIFFLPEAAKGQVRRFRVTFAWPGWFGELSVEHKTNWEWSYTSPASATAASVSFRFVFDAALGPIVCENLRLPSPDESLTLASDNGRSCWTYTNGSVPAARLNWQFRFSS